MLEEREEAGAHAATPPQPTPSSAAKRISSTSISKIERERGKVTNATAAGCFFESGEEKNSCACGRKTDGPT